MEGSIAVTGSAIQWLRDQLGIVASAAEADRLANTVPDTDGLYFVPAFSGLFAPYWRSDARGAIVGMTRFHTAAHLARATLESICYSSYDLVKAMEADAGITMTSLKVDGGVDGERLAMQLQADVLGLDVIRPVVPETTALGAGYAAGLAVGVWDTAGGLPRELARGPTVGLLDRAGGWEAGIRLAQGGGPDPRLGRRPSSRSTTTCSRTRTGAYARSIPDPPGGDVLC